MTAEQSLARDAFHMPACTRPFAIITCFEHVQPDWLHLQCLIRCSDCVVQPFLALALGLQKDGHRVRLATHATFKDYVESYGVEFFPMGKLLHGLQAGPCLSHWSCSDEQSIRVLLRPSSDDSDAIMKKPNMDNSRGPSVTPQNGE